MGRLAKIRKLPVALGIILPLFVLVAGVLLIDRVKTWRPQAAGGQTPQQLKLTNITDASFVVSWITSEPSEGVVNFGERDSLGELRRDVRDHQTQNSQSYLTHFVLLDGLKPETKYYFTIISEGRTHDNSGQPYQVTTAATKTPASSDIAQGRVITAANQPATGAIVYLSLANTIPQAALTDGNGYWLVPLATSRYLDLKNLSNYDRQAQVIEIFVQGESQTATAQVTTGNDNPVPDIVLGQNHNFLGQAPLPTSSLTSLYTPTSLPTQTEGGNRSAPTPTATNRPGQGPNPATTGGPHPASGFGSLAPATENLEIIYPSAGEEVSTTIPEFIGTGPKDQKITIEVHSETQIAGRIEIDPQGSWRWSPTEALSPGEHEVTVSYVDKEGFVQKVSRRFVVLAASDNPNLPSFTATASGERSTPTPTPSLIPTVTPTAVSPTATSTATGTPPTATPTSQSRTTVPLPTAPVPTSGDALPTQIIAGVGVIILILGASVILF